MTHRQVVDLCGARTLQCESEGEILRSGDDVLDLIAAVLGARAEWLVIPASRLDNDFFQLRTRVAGKLLQKFATYRVNVAIVGDISAYVRRRTTLRDFVAEANRGRQTWFVPTMDDLVRRLRRASSIH